MKYKKSQTKISVKEICIYLVAMAVMTTVFFMFAETWFRPVAVYLTLRYRSLYHAFTTPEWQAMALAASFLILICNIFLKRWSVSSRMQLRVLKRSFASCIMKTGWILLLMVMLVMIVVTVRRIQHTAMQMKKAEIIQTSIREQGKILHAAGRFTDENGVLHSYTNSVEAMENSLKQGERYIEVDVRTTSDGELVCIHGWSYILDENGNTPESALSYDEFTRCTTDEYLTPLTWEDVTEYMRQYPDLYIIADVKLDRLNNYKKIAAKDPDLQDRVIAQVYHRKDIDDVYEAGYENIIFTLYKADMEELSDYAMTQLASRIPMIGITVPKRFVKNEQHLLETIASLKMPYYIHTIDKPEKIKTYLESGFDAVYTNLVGDDFPSDVVPE